MVRRMTGFIYKEWKLNKKYILLTMLIPFLVFFITFGIFMVEGGVREGLVLVNEDNGQIILVIFSIIGLAVTGTLEMKTYEYDESKKWAAFVATSAEGVKGYLYVKYMLILGMSLIYMLFYGFAYSLAGTFYYICTKQEIMSGLQNLISILFFAQIFLRAWDMVFVVRFGTRVGKIVKLCVFTIGAIGLVLLMNAFPNQIYAITGCLENLLSTDGNNEAMLIVGILPFACMGCYVLSYLLACKIYLKGALQYGK